MSIGQLISDKLTIFSLTFIVDYVRILTKIVALKLCSYTLSFIFAIIFETFG